MPDRSPASKLPPCSQCVVATLCPLRESGSVSSLSLRPAQRALLEGDAGNPVFIIKQGLLALRQRGPDGRERPLAVLGAGCLIGQSGLLGLPAVFSADAITPAAVCAQAATPLDAAWRLNGEASTLFWQQTRALVVTLTAWSQLQRLPHLRQRLAAALLQLAAQQGHAALMLPRQALLADLLGVTRESISRAWQELLRLGLVQRRSAHSYELDLAGLRERMEVAPRK